MRIDTIFILVLLIVDEKAQNDYVSISATWLQQCNSAATGASCPQLVCNLAATVQLRCTSRILLDG
jgi:hypothetical protein